MRKITDHIINPANDKMEILAIDAPGAGGANHSYRINGPEGSAGADHSIEFQNGPINEVGINGITQEILLALVIDRLRSFQAGPFACRENAIALTKCEEALHWLHSRTRARMLRGVEGRNVA